MFGDLFDWYDGLPEGVKKWIRAAAIAWVVLGAIGLYLLLPDYH